MEYIIIVESNDDETLQELLIRLRKGMYWSAAEREHFFTQDFCCFVNFVKCLREQEETAMTRVHPGRWRRTSAPLLVCPEPAGALLLSASSVGLLGFMFPPV